MVEGDDRVVPFRCGTSQSVPITKKGLSSGLFYPRKETLCATHEELKLAMVLVYI
jgi:hypothetical protein